MASLKQQPKDDGRTIAPMNVEGMPWHLGGPKYEQASSQKPSDIQDLQLTKKERNAIIKGVLMVTMPIVALFVASYFVIFLLMDWFWLA